MRIITRYLCATIVTYVLLVLLFLFGLQIFIEFIHEFPNIGVGNYGLNQIFLCVLLMLPNDIYQFFPMASLLGCVLALGLLASSSELIIMRASGMSLANIASAVIKAALILLVVMVLIGELLSPFAQRNAVKIKTAALSGGQALLTSHGVWINNNHSFININLVSANGKLQGITRYQFTDDQKKLQVASYAKSGEYDGNKWVFNDVEQTEFSDSEVKNAILPQQQWEISLNPKLIGATHIHTDQKSIFELHSYIKYRMQSGLSVANYEFDFWQRVFAPLATLVMILLAIPFIFGPLRSATMGLRMLLGIMVGFGFYVLHQFIGPVSIVYHIPAVLAALLPSLIFTAVGVGMLFKVRQ